MKTSNLIVSAASVEIPWPVVFFLALAALVFLWLILRKGFSLYFKGRDKEITVSTQNPPEKPVKRIKPLQEPRRSRREEAHSDKSEIRNRKSEIGN
jgi:hypothetical protein